MSLFVSNPSKQNVHFAFRTLKDNLLQNFHIAAGGQIEIGQKWDASEREHVIGQIERNGGRNAAESHQHMERFMGLLWRDNHPVDADEIRMAHDAVIDTQQKRSASEVTRSTLAFDRAANNGTRGKRAARTTEVEVHQELAPYQHPTGNEVHFSMSVDPDGRSDLRLPA